MTSLLGGTGKSFVVLLSFIPLILFGLLNTRGIKEPAKLVTAIAGFHFFLLIIMGLWGLVHLGLNWDQLMELHSALLMVQQKELHSALLMEQKMVHL